jgi:hypothetical protein
MLRNSKHIFDNNTIVRQNSKNGTSFSLKALINENSKCTDQSPSKELVVNATWTRLEKLEGRDYLNMRSSLKRDRELLVASYMISRRK